MQATKTALQKKAKEARSYFEQATRPDSDERYWRTKDGSPEWVTDLCRAAHEGGQFLPDDYRYEFLVDSLNDLVEQDDPGEARDNIEADTYTSDLLNWVRSNLNRVYYVNEAVESYGWDKEGGLIRALSFGQVEERREVFDAVLSFLNELVEEED